MSDIIRREDAINALYHHFPSMTMRECTMVLHEVPSAEVTLCHLDSPCEYQNADIAMPSAQPERKTGRWIWKGSINEGFWTCSECGQKFYQGYGNENFCPNCGKRMMKGEENENNL